MAASWLCIYIGVGSCECARPDGFFHLLASISTKHGATDVLFYLDRATHGNTRRPDLGRTMQCLYWSILQLPPWFLSRRNGWWPFCYVLVEGHEEHKVTDSKLVSFMMKACGTACDQFAFVNVVNGFCMTSPRGDDLVIKAVNLVSVADWDQHAKLFLPKGPSGSHPNPTVKHVKGRCVEFIHGYRVHVGSPEYEKLDSHIPESFISGVDELKTIFDNGMRPQLKRREIEFGFKFDP